MRVRAGMAAQLLFWAGSNEMQNDKNILYKSRVSKHGKRIQELRRKYFKKMDKKKEKLCYVQY